MELKKIRVIIVGYGNIGKHAKEAILSADDMELAGIIRQSANNKCPEDYHIENYPVIDEKTDVQSLGHVDVALICKPSRMVEEYSAHYLSKGIHTVDSFDIHSAIVDLRRNLGDIAKKNGSVAIVAAGWDPGSDSVVRALLEAAAPVGITYTNFGPGMSMGHSVVARSKTGVKDALSVTIPLGTGVHRRMVYVQLEEGAEMETVTQAIKTDNYFRNDETHVILVQDVKALADKGHGVNMTRKGKSSNSDNQLFTFDMRVNNPALTAQIMLSCARACVLQQPGAYTMIELPLIDLLPGERENIISRLV